MAGLRQPRPAAKGGQQTGHKDISPMLAAFGLAGAGLSGGAAGADAAVASDIPASGDLSAPSVVSGVSPSVAGAMGANGAINVTGAPYHPGFWANLATRGQAGVSAGIGANQAYYQAQMEAARNATELQKQGLANKGQLDVTGLAGKNSIDFQREHAAHVFMDKNGLAPTMENFQRASTELFPTELNTAKTGSQAAGVTASTGLTDANTLAGIHSSQPFKNALALGEGAKASEQYSKNLAISPHAGLNESIFGNPSGNQPIRISGPTLTGGTKTHRMEQGVDAAGRPTFAQVEQDTSNITPAGMTNLGPDGKPVIPIVKANSMTPNAGIDSNLLSTFGQASGGGGGGGGMTATPSQPTITPAAPVASISPRPYSPLNSQQNPMTSGYMQSSGFGAGNTPQGGDWIKSLIDFLNKPVYQGGSFPTQ